MVSFQINPTEINVLLAILLRLSLCLFMTPIFSSSQVPAVVKALTSLGLSIVYYFVAHESIAPLPMEPYALVGVVVGEILLGVVFSLTVLLLFSAFSLAGELISFQMGFGFAMAADPQSGAPMMELSRWLQMIATLLLFSLNGHHLILRAIADSFRTIPIGGFTVTEAAFGKLMLLSVQMFVIGIKVAAPIMLVMLLTQVGIGLMAKFSPQVNLLATTAPLTILLGFALLAFGAAIWGGAMESYLLKLGPLLGNLTK